VPWHVIYVETPKLRHLSDKRRLQILKSLKLAQEMGSETASLPGSDAIATIIDYARDHNLSKVLVGRDHAQGWRPWKRSFADRVGKLAPDLDIIQVARAETPADRRQEESTGESLLDRLHAPWQSFAMSSVFCALVTLMRW